MGDKSDLERDDLMAVRIMEQAKIVSDGAYQFLWGLAANEAQRLLWLCDEALRKHQEA